MTKVFLHTVLNHTDFFPKILIFPVIYTDLVSDPSGRSGHTPSLSVTLKFLSVPKIGKAGK